VSALTKTRLDFTSGCDRAFMSRNNRCRVAVSELQLDLPGFEGSATDPAGNDGETKGPRS